MTYDPRWRRTKIVATLGPASSSEDIIARLIDAGVNVVRVNSAHGSPDERLELIDTVRRARANAEKHIGILVDLQGPRIRVGTLDGPRTLEPNTEVVFAPEETATDLELPTTYDALAQDVSVGSRILLDDGLLVVEVTGVDGDRVRGNVVHGGLLRSNKGINLPGLQMSVPAITNKDREDIKLAIKGNADMVGISFVRRAAHVEEVRSLIAPHQGLVAKIEKAIALDDLEQIVAVSDAIMVARGDLGVEMPFEKVPLAQKNMIRVAIEHGKTVVTATQMLESMVHSPRPTRAEASDVANAILDGTDAVMLSAETAVGAYPVEAVRAMVRIIHEIERATLDEHQPRRRRSDSSTVRGEGSVEDAIAFATTAAAEMLKVPLIVCFTKSGYTARKIAAHRPATPILGLSTDESTCRNLSLVWGVIPQLVHSVPNYETMLDVAREALLNQEFVHAGDRIIVTAGVPFEVPGTTNLLKVETV